MHSSLQSDYAIAFGKIFESGLFVTLTIKFSEFVDFSDATTRLKNIASIQRGTSWHSHITSYLVRNSLFYYVI